jgi:hypothetical protein
MLGFRRRHSRVRNVRLTNFVGLVALYDFGELHVAGYHGHLIRRLIGVIERLAIAAPEQELPRARILTVDGAHMQRRVT